MLKGGMKFLTLISLSAMLLFVSCGQRMSKVRAPKLVPVIDELKGSPVQVLEEELGSMGTETRGVKLPTVGETLAYEATYSGDKKLSFTRIEGSTSYICAFKYKKTKIIETITTVEEKTYELDKTTIPAQPTFTGAPVSDWEAKCRKDLEDGKFKRNYAFLISDRLGKFKSLVRKNFIDKCNKCFTRARPSFLTCKTDAIEIERKASELVDYIDMDFVGRLKGKALKISASINFDRIYFTNFGILKMDLLGTNPVDFSGLTTIKTLDWKL